MVRFSWSPSFSSSAGRPSGPTAFAFSIESSGNFILRWFYPKCLRDGPLKDFGDDCRVERLRFCVQQRAEVLHQALADEVSISQQFYLLISNVLRVNFSRLFHFRGFEKMQHPPFVSFPPSRSKY